MEDVREDMEELETVWVEETKKEFRKQGRFLIKVFVTIGIVLLVLAAIYLLVKVDWGYERDAREDYLWKQKNYPMMDALYESGNYAALAEFFAEEKNNPIGGWEHSDFYYAYVNISELQEMYQWEEERKELESFDYVMILYDEWEVLSFFQDSTLVEQELGKLAGAQRLIQEKFDTRWNMSEADYKELCRQVEENHGCISLAICEAYVERWLTSRQ